MPTGRVLIAHPSADLYGSDLQLVESVRGLVADGRQVTACLPGPGPLVALLHDAGADVEFVRSPVLRKALLSPVGLLRLIAEVLRGLPRLIATLRRLRPDAVYVNTVTIPLWVVAARLAGRPVLSHVHEAEDDVPRLISLLLNAPLLLATVVVVNSHAAAGTLFRALPRLRRRTRVVHNGVAGPNEEPLPVTPPRGGPRRATLVGRLSPRKGSDVAVEAVALLRSEGWDVDLELHGSVFPGYEWFEEELRERAARADLRGHVHLAGYTSPTWPALARAELVLVPSRAEPFGNTAVEAQLAGRPVIASDVQGLREIVTPGSTGLLVPPGDARALADAMAVVLGDEALARTLAAAGLQSARSRFIVERYRQEIAGVVSGLTQQPEA
ncbi:glycosyltransferase family 1 protein [Blastococcus sp. TF02-8]|uniref:glycosyltransferase n=1 Tax=Blastococcus sp. TF02-8 TaxID=2250574 RepID=UPI000DE9DC4A|nr:glycosyltransferase [Blastococcus sp. TF02-8]RBY95122.1 glycosyltransferase family 1 protein [Blastococcus sp. TF02-8]